MEYCLQRRFLHVSGEQKETSMSNSSAVTERHWLLIKPAIESSACVRHACCSTENDSKWFWAKKDAEDLFFVVVFLFLEKKKSMFTAGIEFSLCFAVNYLCSY